MRGLVWFKKDLRLYDNPALYHAAQSCEDGIVAIYLIDHEMWQQHFTAIRQIEFIQHTLIQLKKDLAEIHVPLLAITVKKTADISQQLLTIMKQLKIETLFFNRELEINEARRDLQVTSALNAQGMKVCGYEDQLILPYQQFFTDNRDQYFKVFSAFRRHWLKKFDLNQNLKLLPIPVVKSSFSVEPLPASCVEQISFTPRHDLHLWQPVEKLARQQLKSFIKNKLADYAEQRDFPMLQATSQLSPYLAIGLLSPRECFVAALSENNFNVDSGNQGALTWMAELLWREFYRHILIAVPRVCMYKAYKIETDQLPWRYDTSLLTAWQNGATGFPLVDAAMRQLQQTGWMHNRLRMVVAMFLSKNLFLDWRLGEQYFIEQLIDGDFASNNGGWQWSASTGTDAVPYFRIFNPITQSERFDPQGKFIRHYCPELAPLDDKAIHNPYHFVPILAQKTGYPRPIIDYALSRKHCLAAFSALRVK